jgi:hypothetical protein
MKVIRGKPFERRAAADSDSLFSVSSMKDRGAPGAFSFSVLPGLGDFYE